MVQLKIIAIAPEAVSPPSAIEWAALTKGEITRVSAIITTGMANSVSSATNNALPLEFSIHNAAAPFAPHRHRAATNPKF
jgi:hypothetical protein